MSWPQYQSQSDHLVSPHKLVTSNTYDWLQYRDEMERADKRKAGDRRSYEDDLSLEAYGHESRASILSANNLQRITRVFTNSDDEEDVGVLSGSSIPQDTKYEIQYSVFKPLRHYAMRDRSAKLLDQSRESAKQHFQYVVSDCIDAIQTYHIELERIKAGSSGSYFAYGTNNHAIPLGVFKPKEEEPYGPLSPKWTKWAHRTFFPCFFGRSCLIPNLGYICESAASLLDQRLKTHLVPYTDTVVLESSKFYDQRQTWLFLCHVEPRKQKKLGSFQLFLKDYIGANDFFEKYPLPGMYRDQFPGNKVRKENSSTNDDSDANKNRLVQNQETSSTNKMEFEWTDSNLRKFRLELEKLIILDYIMRNTDRGLDNWMIKIEPKTTNGKTEWDIKLAAIDNGLAFPWKHPDEWRSYPYGWLYLPLQLLVQPFSETTRRHFLPILTSAKWWDESYREFTNLFSRDSDFKIRMWRKQWAVLKGQAFNVLETLKDIRQGPLELVRRSRCRILDEKMTVPTIYPVLGSAINESIPILATSPMVLNSVSGPLPLLIEDALGERDDAVKSSPTNHTLNVATGSFSNPYSEECHQRSSTKTVIIERLQVVDSTPVFTWC